MSRASVWVSLCLACTSSAPVVTTDANSLRQDSGPALQDAGPGEAGNIASDGGRDTGGSPTPDVAVPSPDAGPNCAALPPGYRKQLCLKPWIQNLTRRDGPEAALCAAEELLSDGAITDCHLLAHFVGEVVIHSNNGDAAQSLVDCPTTCLQGCGHSVMEHVIEERDLNAVFRRSGRAAVLTELRQFTAICETFAESDSETYFLCIHGVGHGLTNSGFVTPPEAAELCVEILGVQAAPCASGVFMEHANQYLRLEEADLIAALPTICDFGESSWRDLCWRNVGESLMWYFGHLLERVSNECNRLPVEDDAKACREGAEREGESAGLLVGSCP
jgi:hypothetical protein